ncbi:response regulator [Mangrovicoccus sp. HB161399]|uniref:response regulator n=1 Tax=Mangrovicoccus sp. HB161399 TaxID=2720392 RepID=UPI001555E535|nr:response regulator [Mangrovicoccus sp. HB161399]
MTTVLIVEDNELNLDMLSRRLARKGFEVIPAMDGEAGLETCRRALPDIVLMDMSLPRLDGWSATRALKADPATAAIPVIALTAHAMEADRQKALAAGCDAFATKPVELPALLAEMARLLERPDR